MSQIVSPSLLERAFEAVRRACQVTRGAQARLADVQQLVKDDRSPVSVADFAAQAVVAHYLGLPNGMPLVGEEDAESLRDADNGRLWEAVLDAVHTVWPDGSAEEVLAAIDAGNHDASAASFWTLDPIDGTKGFLRGQQYSVSLALIHDGAVELAVLGCPNMAVNAARPLQDVDPHGVIFIATRGRGASQGPADGALEDQVLLPMHDSPPEAPIRICESVERSHSKHDATAQVVAALGGGAEPARIDSQCKYGVVARGQADAYLRLPTRPDYIEKIWDHAAGMLIATEAGCVVSDIHGAPLDFSCGVGLRHNQGIVCSTRRFHGAIIEAIGRLPAYGHG